LFDADVTAEHIEQILSGDQDGGVIHSYPWTYADGDDTFYHLAYDIDNGELRTEWVVPLAMTNPGKSIVPEHIGNIDITNREELPVGITPPEAGRSITEAPELGEEFINYTVRIEQIMRENNCLDEDTFATPIVRSAVNCGYPRIVIESTVSVTDPEEFIWATKMKSKNKPEQ